MDRFVAPGWEAISISRGMAIRSSYRSVSGCWRRILPRPACARLGDRSSWTRDGSRTSTRSAPPNGPTAPTLHRSRASESTSTTSAFSSVRRPKAGAAAFVAADPFPVAGVSIENQVHTGPGDPLEVIRTVPRDGRDVDAAGRRRGRRGPGSYISRRRGSGASGREHPEGAPGGGRSRRRNRGRRPRSEGCAGRRVARFAAAGLPDAEHERLQQQLHGRPPACGHGGGKRARGRRALAGLARERRRDAIPPDDPRRERSIRGESNLLPRRSWECWNGPPGENGSSRTCMLPCPVRTGPGPSRDVSATRRARLRAKTGTLGDGGYRASPATSTPPRGSATPSASSSRHRPRRGSRWPTCGRARKAWLRLFMAP